MSSSTPPAPKARPKYSRPATPSEVTQLARILNNADTLDAFDIESCPFDGSLVAVSVDGDAARWTFVVELHSPWRRGLEGAQCVALADRLDDVCEALADIGQGGGLLQDSIFKIADALQPASDIAEAGCQPRRLTAADIRRVRVAARRLPGASA